MSADADRYALHSAYDNAAAVGDAQRYIAPWAERSRALRQQRPAGLDIPYGPRERNRWDVFAAPSRDAPCFVFIHGGYWQRNSREGFACMAEAFLGCGWSAALPGYTLAPDASLTEIVAELRVALDRLQADGERLGVTGPVVLSGWSAGGHLASLIADHPLVAMAAPISGIFDLEPIRSTRYDDALKLTNAEVAALSPLRLAPTRKPTLTFVGGAELPELRRQSRAFHAHRAEAASDGFYEIAGRNHFDVLDDLIAPEGVVFCEIRRTLDAAVRAPRK
jgi:acetyl esterase/lipase